MNTRLLIPVSLVAVSSILASASHAADQFFGFGNTTGSNQLVSTVGWSAYKGTTAATSTIADAFISASPGNPNTSTGFLAILPTIANSRYAVVTTFSSFNANDSTITWALGNTIAGALSVQLLIQSGGNWYVSDSSFTNSGYSSASFASASSASVTQSLNLATATWKSFTLSPGADMSVGSTAVPNDAAITGIGFYATNTIVGGGSVVRLDSLSIPAGAAIPEPASFATLVGGIALLGATLRRSRRR